MSRLGAHFVVVCMLLIAAALGAVLYLATGVRLADALIAAVGLFAMLAVASIVTRQARDRQQLGGQIADLSRGVADLARQVAELDRRASAIERQADTIAEAAAKAAGLTAPITAELGELSNLVKQLAETVALHELKLAKTIGIASQSDDHTPPSGGVAAAPPADETGQESQSEVIAFVRKAIETNRVDLYLQPIVTLPQRKVRYYEAFTRLRREDGTVMPPSEFLGPAEAGGLMARIDQLLLLRSVQVIRRLQIKNRDIGLFCNIAASTLNDPKLFPEILQFMEANRVLAPSLVLEFSQRLLRGMGPLEAESLAALRELGFRFCMDQVNDLRMDPRDLGERGIRHVKVPALLLLGEGSVPSSDIHAADLSDLLGRYGINLIAERIEAEAQVVDLLEYDVRFGQGFLFSQPRPVRADALRGTGDGTETAMQDEAPREQSAGGRTGVAL